MIAALSACTMFSTAIVAGIADVALPVPRLVGLKVIERPISSVWHWTGIAIARVVPVIDMAIESAAAVEPRTCANKYPTLEPVGAIVAIGRAVVRGIVVITVRTAWRHSYADRNLSRCGCAQGEPNAKRRERKYLLV